MRYKDTIKGQKRSSRQQRNILKLYNEHELLYVRMIKKQAQKALEKKQSQLDGNQ